MRCFVNSVATDRQSSDIKTWIPDAGLRRRMSQIIKSAVATAVNCTGDIENLDKIDAVITATGLGCLADSERFLRNIIEENEQMLNPAPFIQSTFNTVGGQIAMLRRNHCYNVTYVNRSHSFEDAVLDALMRFDDKESNHILVGAFDELTPSQQQIMSRMGMYRRYESGEGAVFALLSAEKTDKSIAEIARLDFLTRPLSEKECRKYAADANTVMLINSWKEFGLYPTVSAAVFARGVQKISAGAKEVLIYNEYWGDKPVLMVLKCIG